MSLFITCIFILTAIISFLFFSALKATDLPASTRLYVWLCLTVGCVIITGGIYLYSAPQNLMGIL